jgi:dTDP-4-amino-4,6-dideoxygalactose transaminase
MRLLREPFSPALHREPAFDEPGWSPVADAASRHGLCLPSSLRLEREQVDRVCNAIHG